MKALKGVIALIPTPVTDTGKVDEDSLKRLIDYDLENGCSGVGVLAAIGEGYLFASSDVEKIIKDSGQAHRREEPSDRGVPRDGHPRGSRKVHTGRGSRGGRHPRVQPEVPG